MLIKRWSFYDSQTDSRLPFYRPFSTFSNISDGLCIQVFYSWAWVKDDVK